MRLTRREAEVARLIGQGFANIEITDKIGRSIKTVEAHRASLGKKLGYVRAVQICRWAILFGLADATDDHIKNGWEIGTTNVEAMCATSAQVPTP